jgi:hypothetical protein
MSLRDKPYLALYVQDFLTDERLNECSASATGVYIRLMCIMHKSEEYGKILLKQKDKQSDKQILNFASKLAKHMPYTTKVIEDALNELISEGCLSIQGDSLNQKRMISDEDLSVKRSLAGKLGGESTQKSKRDFALAKDEANYKANADNDNDINNSSIKSIEVKKEVNISKSGIKKNVQFEIIGLGKMNIDLVDNCEDWQMENIIDFLTKSQREFETIAMNKPTLRKDGYFCIALQKFVENIQESGQYSSVTEMKRYFRNFINDKNGSLEEFIKGKQPKDDKNKLPKIIL